MLTESKFTKQLKKIGRVKTRSTQEMKLTDPETGKLTVFNTMAETLDKKMKETAESESKRRELFDSLRAGIYQCEPGVEGRFTWVNHAVAEIFGYSSPEDMIGTKVKDIC